MQALITKKSSDITVPLIIATVCTLVVVSFISIALYLNERVIVDWRAAITERAHHLYFEKRVLYQLICLDAHPHMNTRTHTHTHTHTHTRTSSRARATHIPTTDDVKSMYTRAHIRTHTDATLSRTTDTQTDTHTDTRTDTQTKEQVDNPDQRIAEATKEFTSSFISTLFGSYSHAFGGVFQFFSVIASFVSLSKYGYLPILLSLGLFAIVCVCVVWLMRPIARLTFQQNKYEGDFRFLHNRVRTFCECIVFYGGEVKVCDV